MTDDIDAQDYRTLLVGILNQAIEDYVKLQHPSTRVKVYLQEHYLTAVDMIFDPEYRLVNLPDGPEGDMSILDLLSEVLDSESPKIKLLQDYVIKQTREYWENKDMPVLDHIPDSVCVAGQVFDIHHAYIKGYAIDLDSKTITLDKENTQSNQINFLESIVVLIGILHELHLKSTLAKTLTKEIYWTLKTNNCFSSVGLPKSKELFKDLKIS